MQMTSTIRTGAVIFAMICFLGLLRVQAELGAVAVDSAKASKEGRTVGDKGKYLAMTKVVTADNGLIEKAILAKSKMKEIRRTANDKEAGPQTIEEAAAVLSHRINMACPPTKCFEHEGIFFFSGGTAAKPVDDFSSGLAVKRGGSTIYEWIATDEPVKEEVK